MAEAFHSPLAELDLLEIWHFIAEDNEDAANRFLDFLASKCQVLAESPKIGRPREDLAPNLRCFPVKRYIIFYRQLGDDIEIVRFLSAYRDVEAIFRRRKH